jgi:hypothetical protein
LFEHVIKHGYLFAGLGLLTGAAFAGVYIFKRKETVRKLCFLAGMAVLIIAGLLGMLLDPLPAVTTVYLSSMMASFAFGLLVLQFMGINYHLSWGHEAYTSDHWSTFPDYNP